MTTIMHVEIIQCFMIGLYETFLYTFESILIIILMLLYMKEKFTDFTVPSLSLKMSLFLFY